MATQILPQAVVYQEYNEVAASIVEPLRAFILGPDYVVYTYTDNYDDIYIGEYDATKLVAAFPEKMTSDVVDADYTKVYIDDAMLRYFYDEIGSDATWTATATEITNDTVALVTNGIYTRDASLPRDVQVGDYVIASNGSITFTSQIIGFDAELTTPVVSAAEPDSGNTITTTTLATSAGTYTGDEDDVYKVEFINSGVVGFTPGLAVRVLTSKGLDVSGPHLVGNTYTPGTAISIGTKGVTVSFAFTGDSATSSSESTASSLSSVSSPVSDTESSGSNTESSGGHSTSSNTNSLSSGSDEGTYGGKVSAGDSWSIAVTAAKEAQIRTIKTAEVVPAALILESDLTISICAKQDIQLETFTQSAAAVTIPANSIYDDAVLGATYVLSGSVRIEWRGISQRNVSIGVQSIQNIVDLPTYFPNNQGPDSVLAYGIGKCLANANGTDVYFAAVSEETVAAYLAVMETVAERNNVYGTVLLTHNRAIIDAVQASIESLSSPEQGRWRVMWAAPAAITSQTVITGLTATVTDDPEQAGNQYVLVESSGATFLTSGVRANDVFTIRGVDYVVNSVVNNERLILESGPALPISGTPESYVITRVPSAADKTSQLILDNSFANKRVRYILANPEAAEGIVDSYFLAAALAGLRSGVVPHQGLTNVAISGFTRCDMSEFSRTQLDQLANAGYWIVTQDANTGVIYTRKQLTTDTSSVDTAEDSVVATDDAISYQYAAVIGKYIGKTNVVESNLGLIRTDLDAVTKYLQNTGYTERLGPMVIDATVRELRRHAVYADRAVAIMDITRPAPLNNLELYLVFSF